MATARREGPDVETEEFNPFLSPPPPPLNPAIIAAPALPPRDNNGRNSAGFSSTGSNAETASAPFASSRGRHPSRTSNGDVGGNLVASQAAHQQQQGRNPFGPPPPPPHAVPAPTTATTAGPRTRDTATLTSNLTPPAAAAATTRRDGGGRSGSHNRGSRSGGGGSSGGSAASAFPVAATSPSSGSTTATARISPTHNSSCTTPASTTAPAPAPAPASRGSGRNSGGNSSSSGSNAVSGSPASAIFPSAASSPASASSPTTTTASITPRRNSGPSSPRRGSGTWSWGNVGRSLIGAVLGPNAVGGGDGGGGAGDRATGGCGSRVRFRELTPHDMQQTADGKFSVSVWRKNKQDAEPVQVSVGVYTTAYEGQRAAESFSPPLWQEPAKDSRCSVCDSTFGYVLKRRHHCRNCGRLVCSACAETFWPRNMLPPTYSVDTGEKKVRVCSTCHGAGENFRKALLAGSEEDAMAAFSTGCVNLRVPYSIYHNELPVHCAAAGGNLNILAWLVDDRCCPLFLDREKKIALGDSRRQSVMGAAAASGRIPIMRYLAFTQGCKVTEIRDMNSLWGALEKCLYDGANVVPEAGGPQSRRTSPSTSGGGSGGGGGYPSSAASGSGGAAGGAEVAAPSGDDDNSCIVCFERKVDCTLVPCGHHCCCLTCAAQFELCPVCRADVEQKIRAISV